jgi:hypothetical protein
MQPSGVILLQKFLCHFLKDVKSLKEIFLASIFLLNKFHISFVRFRSLNTIKHFSYKTLSTVQNKKKFGMYNLTVLSSFSFCSYIRTNGSVIIWRHIFFYLSRQTTIVGRHTPNNNNAHTTYHHQTMIYTVQA